jgi:outer membrane protein OmpA-like peptidoglycan-associated protein
MKMFFFHTILCLCIIQSAHGQWNYTVESTSGINTAGHDVITSVSEGRVFFSSSQSKTSAQQTWSISDLTNVYCAERTSNFLELTNPQKLHSFKNVKNESGASYSNSLDGYFISSEQSYSKNAVSGSKLYFLPKEKGSIPQLIPFCDDNASYYHPYFVDELNLLLFASNRRGGQGGLDVWYSYYHNGAWTNPANCGGQVNTSGEEVYPTFFNNDIYFSSNGWVPEKGFELFKAEGSAQWMNALQLEYPLNSEADDFSIVFLNSEKGLLSSNRNGTAGLSDIFYFKKVVTKLAAHGYTAKVESDASIIPQAKLKFYDTASELILATTTNYQGVCDLDQLSLDAKFTVKIEGVSPELFTKLRLVLMDESNNVLGIYTFNEKGELVLELLKFIYSDLPLIDNEDKSILNISFSGRIQSNSSHGVASIISILDMNGNIIAVIRSDKLGQFSVENVRPEREYVFKLSKDASADQIVLFDNGKTIVLPILASEAYYRRIPPGEGITLLDENKRTVTVRPEDLCIVNRVYFDHNSSALNTYAKQQLDAVTSLLEANPQLEVDICSYADARGAQAYNLQLSKQRSISLLQYLKKSGIAANRINYSYRGEDEILNECDDSNTCVEEKHAINRRTEIKFVTKELTYSNSNEPENRN